MKMFLLATYIAIGCPIVFAQEQLIVTVKGVDEFKGSVMVGLFADKNSFLKTPAYGQVVPLVAGQEIRAVFRNIPPGDYAISIIHDANDNGKLDTNRFGIPREGFGFGNNAMGIFGPPSFAKAKITLGKDPVRQVLQMKYMF